MWIMLLYTNKANNVFREADEWPCRSRLAGEKRVGATFIRRADAIVGDHYTLRVAHSA